MNVIFQIKRSLKYSPKYLIVLYIGIGVFYKETLEYKKCCNVTVECTDLF